MLQSNDKFFKVYHDYFCDRAVVERSHAESDFYNEALSFAEEWRHMAQMTGLIALALIILLVINVFIAPAWFAALNSFFVGMFIVLFLRFYYNFRLYFKEVRGMYERWA